MVRRLVLGVLLGVACFPPPLDASGRRCDPTHSCGSGYLCFDGYCTLAAEADAGPDNRLDNGGFEKLNDAGDPSPWKPLPATTAGGDLATDTVYVREGLRSVRLFSPDGGDQPGVQQQNVGKIATHEDETWCVRAWVRSSSPDAGLTAQIFLRERDDAGTIIGENEPRKSPVGTNWVVIEDKYVTKGAPRIEVRVQHGARIRKQDLLWVDDVRLKRSATGDCVWAN